MEMEYFLLRANDDVDHMICKKSKRDQDVWLAKSTINRLTGSYSSAQARKALYPTFEPL